MSVAPAERCFDEGLAALASGRPLAAVDHFLEAMQTEQRLRVRRPDMRYLSYYGLSLAQAHRRTHAALEACTLAVRHDPTNPLLLLNLGCVHRRNGRITAALACFERGLSLAPNHRGLRREMARADRRERPCLPFLRRGHPLNRWLGRWRAARHGGRTMVGRTLGPTPSLTP